MFDTCNEILNFGILLKKFFLVFGNLPRFFTVPVETFFFSL